MSNDDIDCRICDKRHHRDTCPMVKELDSIEVWFCETCGINYTNGCKEVEHTQTRLRK